MKDLKHLYTLEKLLESANNELVQQAVEGGKHALGYTCYHMPEVLLNAVENIENGSKLVHGLFSFVCDFVLF